MTTQPQTVADLTARKAKLEARRAELEAQLTALDADLERLHRDHETPVADLVDVEVRHRTLMGVLERVEAEIAEVDVQLVSAEATAASEARLEELREIVRTIRENRQGFTEAMTRAGAHLREDLEVAIEHREAQRQLHLKLHGMLNSVVPGLPFHPASFNRASDEQVRAAEALAKDFTARGLDLQDAYEGGASYPEPFEGTFKTLLDIWEWNRHKYVSAQDSTKEVSNG